MKPIICFGEALIDFLNTQKTQDGVLSLNEYRQYPGGAPANAAVAVAKLGGNAFFLGQIGSDSFGEFIENALISYGVNTQYTAKHPSAKTALAFVTLDKDGDRSFEFYRHQTADILFTPEQIQSHWFSSDTLFHFCSNTLTDVFISNTTQAAIDKAKTNNSTVCFDVNLRHSLWEQKEADIARVNSFVLSSDIIKFSLEELEYLAQGNNSNYINDCLKQGVKLIIVTNGEFDIEFYSNAGNGTVSPPKVKAIDTTAGGDAFIGAFLFSLSQMSHVNSALSSTDTISQLITFASTCSGHAVTRSGAFPALPSFNDVKDHWPEQLFYKNK